MKRLLCILLILAAGVDALAVGFRVRGRVTDAQGEPLPGAVVHLDENYLWAVTDARPAPTGWKPNAWVSRRTCGRSA